jgi:hypothetical protein
LLLEMPTTRRAARNATNLLTATPDEAVIIIACALTDPTDLLRLAAACRRFFIKCIAAPSHRTAYASGSAAEATAPTEMWSIAEEVARRWIVGCTDQEQGWVPRRGQESWLGLMWEMESLRRGAVFGRSHEVITLSEGGAVATRNGYDMIYRTTASKAVMRAGHHYAQFTVANGDVMFFGVIRPGWDVEGGDGAISENGLNGHCFYGTCFGKRYPGRTDWEGRQHAMKGDRIGLLLDLEQGTMTVYKNDERLGVMATGLSGEYSWAVTLGEHGGSTRIEAAEVPASPTATALA